MSEPATVDQSLARFEKALHALETALTNVKERQARLNESEGQNSALKDEHDKLTKELEQVRARADELSEANQAAARRVDQAIERVERVLG